MPSLKRIQIKGFRSIKEATLELRPLNVLIGANGAGKSNLIAFFKLLNELTAGRLQQHIGTTGHATANLHFGPRMTPQLEAEMEFEVENGTDTYRIRLFHAAGDSLIFADEQLRFHQKQTFADTVLKPHLASFCVYMQKPVLIAHGRKKGRIHRGGGRNFTAMQNDITRRLKEDSGKDVFFTTMLVLLFWWRWRGKRRFPAGRGFGRDSVSYVRHTP